MDKYEQRRLNLQTLIRKNYGGVAAALARATGIDPSYVSRMLYPTGKAGKKRIGEDIVEKINQFHSGWDNPFYGALLDINKKQQLTINEQPAPYYGNVGEKIELRGRVPLISYVAAGNWSESVDNFQPGDAEDWIATTIQVRQHTYALRVQGDSMEPKFPAGALIIVEPEDEARNGSYVIVRQNGNEATFKQLVIDGGQKYLKPLNNRYPIMEMQPDAVICGVVKQMVMDIF